jgi:hypothetical protein
MGIGSTNPPERQLAQRMQERFGFYFLSLVFALLALSVQTSEFGRSTLEDIFELGGWIALLTAGLVGLWRMEWEPLLRLKLGIRDEYQQAQPVNESLVHHDDALRYLNPLIEKLEGPHKIKYRVAKYAFILGVVLVLASRSAQAIADLLGYELYKL